MNKAYEGSVDFSENATRPMMEKECHKGKAWWVGYKEIRYYESQQAQELKTDALGEILVAMIRE